MSQWNFHDRFTISNVDFDRLKEVFKDRCRYDTDYFKSYFSRDEFEFFFRSKPLKIHPGSFPAIKVTVAKSENGLIIVDYRLPSIFLWVFIPGLLAVIIGSFIGQVPPFVPIIFAIFVYIFLLVIYGMGTNGIEDALDSAKGVAQNES